MGEFLSTPNKEKESYDSENEILRFGSCGMQGWRKRMERYTMLVDWKSLYYQNDYTT